MCQSFVPHLLHCLRGYGHRVETVGNGVLITLTNRRRQVIAHQWGSTHAEALARCEREAGITDTDWTPAQGELAL